MENEKKQDLFARIAETRARQSAAELIEPQPLRLPEVALPAGKSDPKAAFAPAPKLDTAAKLRRELTRMRRAHAKFLAHYAPPIREYRTRLPVEEFDWRVGTDEDAADFPRVADGRGEWERIRIPHYGAPLGRAVVYYRTTFHIDEKMWSRGALFICFKGVDYKAHVFVNGVYIGSHEGFFAPFEFEITRAARIGRNVLLVKVENDAICMSNDSWGEDGHLYEGDKLYAATGPGYDEPRVGWHHCPPGMGIYQDVLVEARSRLHIGDVFVRPVPEESRAEVWVEVNSCHATRRKIAIELSVFGSNFRHTVVRDRRHDLPGEAGPGVNYYRLPIEIAQPRWWNPDTPWLYEAQARLLDEDGAPLDTAMRPFGMRSFRMDEHGEPKGRYYLNGQPIRLRGANTMGFEQQDVMKKDWNRLIDDILLAKICHMNFLRLTQRPVQPEVYEYCDRLGLMTQTDLPLFGVLRRNQFAEAVRQAGEMERLIRSHPCNIVDSFINEPFPNAWDKPHRHLNRPELESFFVAACAAVRLANPDRVVKPVDGDYDPPAPGLPDNHCYCGWYNGHGVDIGMLHKGYWQKVKPGWFYGCGEFGAEGLDPVPVMRAHYPPEWLPQTAEEDATWMPDRIPQAQTGRFHYMWFETQHGLEHWVRASLAHQAWATRLMAEAFRRDDRLNSMAIHLFIDAFPSGWMKSIMDVERNPKPAYFAYREALTPLMANLRSDRQAYFAGEPMEFEAWVCNDLNAAPQNVRLHYQLEVGGRVVFANRAAASVPVCGSAFQGYLRLAATETSARVAAVLRLALVDRAGKVLHDCAAPIEVFPRPAARPARPVRVVGALGGKASALAAKLGLAASRGRFAAGDRLLLIDDVRAFAAQRNRILAAVRRGAIAIFLELEAGDHEIDGDKVVVTPCGMNARHFASRATGHPIVAGFEPEDFRFWFDADKGYVTPFLASSFTASDWRPILLTGNGNWATGWKPEFAAAEKIVGDGCIRICQVALANRIPGHPAALLFARRLLGLEATPMAVNQ